MSEIFGSRCSNCGTAYGHAHAPGCPGEAALATVRPQPEPRPRERSDICRYCEFRHSPALKNGTGLDECRRHAPIIVSPQREAVWPAIAGDDWCGEFEVKRGTV